MTMAEVMEAVFAPADDPRAARVARLWIPVLLIGGLIGWAYVMGFGRTPLDFHDWTGINLPRLQFLQNALRTGQWPLHMAGSDSLHGVTDRFLTLPDVITSPQAIALLFMPVAQFVVADVLIHYALGFAGLLLLRRHLRWSLATLTLVVLLFLFNGHILAHYSVGHFSWGPYFLFPVIAWLILRFLDGDHSWRSIASFAGVMFYMVLAGGQHHVTWVLLLLALMMPFCGRRAWWLAAVAIASGLLSAVRLLPPVLELHAFKDAGLVADVIGFPSVSHLLGAMVTLRRETPAFNPSLPGNIWFFDSAFYEFNAYVGIAGLVLIGVGVYLWLRDATPRYYALAAPIAVMVALSIGSAYRVMRMLAIPMLDGERYTARLFSLPLLLLIVMAATAIDQSLRDGTIAAKRRLLMLGALVLVAIDTSASVRLWRVAVSSGLFGPTPFNAADAMVANHPDPQYLNIIGIGLAITAVTAVVLGALVYREKRSPHALPAQETPRGLR
jgi:hypothetical protein